VAIKEKCSKIVTNFCTNWWCS